MPPTGRTRSRALDPLVAALVALTVYAAHGFGGSLDRDQATFVYGGIRLAHGTPPYRGIFNSVGPLGDMASAVGVRAGWLLGLDALTGARVLFWLLSAACVAGVCVLAREALDSRAAGLVAAAGFLTFAGFLDLATDGPREKTLMVLFLEGALLLLLRRRWLGAGALTALATLTWQPVLLPATVAAALAVAGSGSGTRRLRAAGAWVLGGVLPTAVLAAYLLAAGALRVAVWGFVGVNVEGPGQPSILSSWHLVTAAYRWSLPLLGLGLVALAVPASAALARAARGRPGRDTDRALLVLGGGALAAVLWSCAVINGGADLFVVLPFAAVGLAALVLGLTRRLGAAAARRSCAAVVVAAVALASVESVSTRDTRLAAERRDVTRTLAVLPRGSTVLSVSAPEVLVLAHRRNPYPWQLSDGPISSFLDHHLPGGLAAYAGRVARLHPALVAVGRRTADGWLLPVLRRDYVRVGRGQHWAWYAARSLGRATLRLLRVRAGARGGG